MNCFYRWALPLVGLLAALCPAKSESARYQVEIKAQRPDASPTAMVCVEGSICQGEIDLVIDKEKQSVTVIALFVPGNAFIRFEASKESLWAGSQSYFHVSLGITRRASFTIVVNEPTPESLSEAKNRLVIRPVLRGPMAYVATVDVDVRPDGS